MIFDPRTCDRRSALAALCALALPLAGVSRPASAGGGASRWQPGSIAPVLAGIYTGQVEPARCLVSEKYDGVRAVWDGRVLRHRSGRVVTAPPAFVAALPAEPLDGELWLGRGRFEALCSVVLRGRPRAAEWAGVRYVVFDLPGGEGSFSERADRLRAVVARAGAAQLVCAAQAPCADRAALQRRLDETVASGGEGLMLHVAAARWQAGRSDALLKLKPHLDAEAEVVAYRAGNGRHDGAVGALEVRSADGRRFFLGNGLSDGLRRDPPRVGEIVTYRFRDLTASGLPRFATYLRRHVAT
ncbi:MAG: DNA ligase [Caldimonas sp.]